MKTPNKRKKSNENNVDDDTGNVKVVCRFRPLNKSEQEKAGVSQICEFSEDKKSVTIKQCRGNEVLDSGGNKFTFDRVFDMDVTQREVYEQSAKPIIEGVLKGFNGTVFAYGQTGSGKTHTMQGPSIDDVEVQGIVPRMVRTVFNKIENLSENIEFTVKVSMAEIYMEQIKDLLNPAKVNLKIKENRQKGIHIQDLTEKYIGAEADVYEVMRIGNENRKTSSTAMNDTSSRSHSIFTMNITQNNLDDFSSKSGTLYLVDLAGSEKVSKTNVSGQQLDEAKGINKSLSTLGKVILALTDKNATHIPYRESKLTRILTESLGGNAKTCLIITGSPSPYNEMETVSTMRFGTAARNIKNKPKVNREYTVPELKRMIAIRDQLVSALKRRIKSLEKFINENGLILPTDETLESLAKRLGSEVQKSIEEEGTGEFESTPQKDTDVISEDEHEDEEEKDDTSDPQEIEFNPYGDQEEAISEYDIIDEADQSDDLTTQKAETKEIIKLVESGDGQNHKEIIGKFLALQEQLKTEKENSYTQIDVLSNLKEDNEVLKSKIKKFQDEKEEFLSFKEMADQKIQDLKDKAVEAEGDATTSRAKLDLAENELSDIKKSYAIAKNKIDRLGEKANEAPEEVKRATSTEENETIRSELRTLNDEIRRRDDLIDKIQNMSSLDGDIRSIIEQSQEKLLKNEKETRQKANDSVVKGVLLNGEGMKNYTGDESCYLSAAEAYEVISKQRALKEKLTKNNEKNKKLKSEVDRLKNKIKALSEIDQNDLNAITDALVEDKVLEVKEKFEEERDKIMSDLADRVGKVCELKIQLDAQQEETAKLEMMLSGNYSTKNHIKMLEGQVESINEMYHNIASDSS